MPATHRHEPPGTSGTGRHSVGGDEHRFATGFEALAGLADHGAQVSANVLDRRTGRTLLSIDDRRAMPTASLGRILLLIEVSARMTAKQAAGFGIVDRSVSDAAAGAGLWRHLQAPVLPLVDLAVLVGAVDDNVASNTLLRRIGLESVRSRAESLGLVTTSLLDRVRDSRGPDDAPHPSVGAAAELTWLVTALSRGRIVDHATSCRVLDWLSNGVDLSMVASGFGLDPLAHRAADHGILLTNATGSGRGVRTEVGLLSGPRGDVAYALTVQFADTSLAARREVLGAMRVLGLDLLEYVT